MRRKLCQLTVWLSIAVATGVPIPINAQQGASATITGTVYDPTNAVVEGATVTLRQGDTNQVLETKTDRRGQYQLLYVPVGEHRLTVAVPGFVTTTMDLTLGVGQAINLPIKLTAATRSEIVSVSAETPLVEAGRTQVADTITPSEIDSLPLNGRNYLDLALLAPNVSRTNTRSNERFAETSAVPGTGISVAGQRNIGNSSSSTGSRPTTMPPILRARTSAEEVIREFQVVTSGGTCRVRPRLGRHHQHRHASPGTNQQRGRAYGFFRNDSLDAQNPLATREDPLSHRQVRPHVRWTASRGTGRSGSPTSSAPTSSKTGVHHRSRQSNVDAINRALDQAGYPVRRSATGDFPTGTTRSTCSAASIIRCRPVPHVCSSATASTTWPATMRGASAA